MTNHCIHRAGCPKPDVCREVGHCTSMTAEDLQTQSMTNVLSSACVHCGLTSDIPKCGIKCARAEREIALLREQRDTNLAKEVETVEQLHAAVKTAQELAATRLQEVERLKRDVRQFNEAIYWALGERGDFPDKLPGCGPWYWRTELRKRSGLPVNGRPDNEPLPSRTDHAENLAKALEHYLKAHDTLSAVQDTDAVSGTNEASDCGLHDAANDAWRGMRTALFEYRKHAQKSGVSGE